MSTSKITPERQIHLIGLTGYAGTGKDTVRALLQKHGFEGFAFADPIRNMVRELLRTTGIGEHWMDWRECKEEVIPALGVSYRHMAQTLGTEWGRNALAPDFWLTCAHAHLVKLFEQKARAFVVSDVRFANEAAWVQAHGGVIWRVHRDAAQPVRDHVSESSIDDIAPALTIHNNGTLDELEERVVEALRGVA